MLNKKGKKKRENGINLGEDKAVIELLKWLKSKGWSPTQRLRAARFSSTGRGLQALQRIRLGSVIVSIPLECCITRHSLSQGWMAALLNNLYHTLPTQVLLACWLSLTDEEEWRPYLNSLPREYSLPLFYSQTELDSLPGYIASHVKRQRQAVEESFNSLHPFIPNLNRDRYTWGYATVNTRAVFLRKDPRDSGEGESGENALALVPFLDLLNHSDEVTVEAEVNITATREGRYCYEIRKLQGVRKYEEAFICYGKHSNTKLLVEYGFFLGVESRSEHISLQLDDILQFFKYSNLPIVQCDKKIKILTENGLTVNLGLGLTGLHWNTKAVMFVLLLEAGRLNHWHQVFQQEQFQELEEVCKEFTQYFLRYLISCRTNMAAIQSPSKYFHLGLALVQSHIEMIQLVLSSDDKRDLEIK